MADETGEERLDIGDVERLGQRRVGADVLRKAPAAVMRTTGGVA
jgi:hypothetical protein